MKNSKMTHVLVIDDDPEIRLFLGGLLDTMGYGHEHAGSLHQAKALISSTEFDLVLLDLELPDGNGLDLIPELAATSSLPEIIIITGTGDAEGARLAFQYGAWDYIHKPFLLNEVTLPITRAVQYRKEKKNTLKPILKVRKKIIGTSDAIQTCLDEAARAAATDVSVLITGETGTGKELFARAIHENSRRRAHPFIAVDCGALPESLVENTLFGHEKGAFTGAGSKQEGLVFQADKGTLMLDEVGNLSLTAQKSLLRTLQEKSVRPVGSSDEIHVDIRLVAATNLDLEQMVKQKSFREDLLFRIKAMEIKLPPLRKRECDIKDIAENKINELTELYHMEKKELSLEFLDELKTYPWPGNIRELINVLEFSLATAGNDPTLFPKHLPPEYRVSGMEFNSSPVGKQEQIFNLSPEKMESLPTFHDFRRRMEKIYLKELLRRTKGHEEACLISGISRSRLYGLLNEHSLPGFK